MKYRIVVEYETEVEAESAVEAEVIADGVVNCFAYNPQTGEVITATIRVEEIREA